MTELTPEQQSELLDKAIATLNGACAEDRDAIHALICMRTPCNRAMADGPNVLVHQNPLVGQGSYTVGLLGVLNGVLKAIGLPPVAAEFEDPDKGPRFLGFCRYRPPDSEKPAEE